MKLHRLKESTKETLFFGICMAAATLMSTGEGAFFFQIVTYLESKNVPTFQIGFAYGFLAAAEGIVCVLIGYIHKGKHTKLYIFLSAVFLFLSALILSFEPLGLIALTAVGLNGIGIGAILVVLYSTLMNQKPKKMSTGLAVGLYTGVIAGGNAFGAWISGIIIENNGFRTSFLFCCFCFILLMIASILIKKEKEPTKELSEEKESALRVESKTGILSLNTNRIWLVSLTAGFSMAGIVALSSMLVPLYILRSGLSITFLSMLAGLKMFLAAVIRPFSGAILTQKNILNFTNISFFLIGVSIIITPFVGLSIGLIIISILFGISFGICRVSTATLALVNIRGGEHNSKRIGLYSASMTIAQIVTPIAGGWLSETIGLSTTLVLFPVFFLLLYILSFLIINKTDKKLGAEITS